jgi:hypothetical protein
VPWRGDTRVNEGATMDVPAVPGRPRTGGRNES